ncbi:MAG: ribose 5-phosphate isomerase B [Myxococcales bacterium]
MKIYASSDHAGFQLRQVLVDLLRRRGIEVDDLGPRDGTPRDYADEAGKVGRLVRNTPEARGLLVCGSGIGMCMAANKMSGIRAVDAWSVEAARLSRAHNDANVLCLGARLISQDDARAILEVWLSTDFDGGRHAARVAGIDRVGGATATDNPGSAASAPGGLVAVQPAPSPTPVTSPSNVRLTTRSSDL